MIRVGYFDSFGSNFGLVQIFANNQRLVKSGDRVVFDAGYFIKLKESVLDLKKVIKLFEQVYAKRLINDYSLLCFLL